MHLTRAGVAASCAALVVATVGCQPAPSPWRSEPVSVDATGTKTGNDESFRPVFSPDGTKVAFVSFASDLGPTDTNGTADIYVRDLTSGVTTLLSTNAAGRRAPNGTSSDPVFSPDGTKVAFVSRANDLGPPDDNDSADIYVRDLATGATTLVSVNAAGVAGGNAGGAPPAFSPDGTKVAFATDTNLLPGQDPPREDWGNADVYVRDLTAATTTLVSVGTSGTSGNRESTSPVFGPDARMIAFASGASDLGPTDTNGFEDLYVRDLDSGTTSLVSAKASGDDAGNGSTLGGVTFSPDGTRIVFGSEATDLVSALDDNGAQDIFVRDLRTGTTTLVTTNGTGTASANGWSSRPILSPDGTKVAFSSAADDLGPPDTNDMRDVFVRDLQTGATTLVSAARSGASGNSESSALGFSPDGTKVVFSSYATNLGPRDTDDPIAPEPAGDDTGVNDIYVRDLTAGTTRMVSTNAEGTDSANHSSPEAVFSPDGLRIAFTTHGTDLGFTDVNEGPLGPLPDVYVATLHGAELAVALDADPASVAPGGTIAYGLDVRNDGPDPAESAVAVVLLPEQTRLVGVEATAGTCTSPEPEYPNVLVCELGTLSRDAGVGATITVVVDAAAGSVLDAVAATGSQTLELDGTDNTGRVTVTVVEPEAPDDV